MKFRRNPALVGTETNRVRSHAMALLTRVTYTNMETHQKNMYHGTFISDLYSVTRVQDRRTWRLVKRLRDATGTPFSCSIQSRMYVSVIMEMADIEHLGGTSLSLVPRCIYLRFGGRKLYYYFATPRIFSVFNARTTGLRRVPLHYTHLHYTHLYYTSMRVMHEV